MTRAVADPASVLVVDDDATYRTALARALQRRGFAVHGAESVAMALVLLGSTRIDYASIDLRMPGASGLELVRHIKASQPAAVVVVLTGYGSIATAVEAMKLGAAHYLTKPADAVDLLRAFGVHSAAEPAPAAAEPAAEVPSLARVEWEHLCRVVGDCGGNISKAARLLGLQRRSLQRKLAKYPAAK